MRENDLSYSSVLELVSTVHALLIVIAMLSLSVYYPHKANIFNYGPFVMITILFMGAVTYWMMNTYNSEGRLDDLWIFMGMGKSILSAFKYAY